MTGPPFRAFLDANNTGGLEGVWRRATPAERLTLLSLLDEGPAHSEAHEVLRALVDPALPLDVRVRRVEVGLEALSDLASLASADRRERLARWAGEPAVREALLVTAAQRGPRASPELVDWLASVDDDGLTDALIPIFLAAVDRRDGARLAQLARWAQDRPTLSGLVARAESLKATSRAEWGAFLDALGLSGTPPFTATCSFRASEPAIVLEIDPRRLNWFTLRWGEARVDSAGTGWADLPALPRGPLASLPAAIRGAMRARGLRGQRVVHCSGDAPLQARLEAWCSAT
ncbi:MAG: hypothetical protein SFW67_09315 [Myxococcaceae bacterium]|nr:hypothetical protein [Myxococcaceae bacterium]